tara:strand:+ start:1467 stop:2504 length:1038 start_codon:yes stop_codon:yes gene_type:complete
MTIKVIRKECKSILKKIDKLNITKFNYHFVINEIILINLKIENILFNKKGNPISPSLRILKNFNNYISELKQLKNHDKKISLKKNNFIKENDHKILFQNLWQNFSFSDFNSNRIQRYIKRIKINKIEKIIKGKKIIDLGCGHGNFLMSCYRFGPKFCLGIDYGSNSIKFANKIKKKMGLSSKKIIFKTKSVYKTGVKNGSFDFAIQNGVFHHLDNEKKAYIEAHRVLKKNGFFWIYTDGGGGLRDIIYDMCQKVLKRIDKNYVITQIRSCGLNNSKEYLLGDNMNAEYRHTTYKKLTNFLKKTGFKNFRQLDGGFYSDFDKPFSKDKYFKEKFGSGDLRILCQKN